MNIASAEPIPVQKDTATEDEPHGDRQDDLDQDESDLGAQEPSKGVRDCSFDPLALVGVPVRHDPGTIRWTVSRIPWLSATM